VNIFVDRNKIHGINVGSNNIFYDSDTATNNFS